MPLKCRSPERQLCLVRIAKKTGMQTRCIGWTVDRNTGKEHLLQDIRALYIPGCQPIADQRHRDICQDIHFQWVLRLPIYTSSSADHLDQDVITIQFLLANHRSLQQMQQMQQMLRMNSLSRLRARVREPTVSSVASVAHVAPGARSTAEIAIHGNI